ncbi:MAG: hypothetical protein RR495_05430 [Anaerovoracaceae bacterium]
MIYSKLEFLPKDELEEIEREAKSLKLIDSTDYCSEIKDIIQNISLSEEETGNIKINVLEVDRFWNTKYENSTSNFSWIGGIVSEKNRDRAFKIINTLVQKAKELKWKVNKDLSFSINGEVVSFELFEFKSKKTRSVLKNVNGSVLTKKEYYYEFNGNFGIMLNGKVFLMDNSEIKLEDRLPYIFCGILFETHNSGPSRKKYIEIKEEQELSMVEEKVVISELLQFEELLKLSNGYSRAEGIRNYINACIKNKSVDLEYAKWAFKKADWIDPSVDYDDEILGKINKYKTKQ